MSESASTSFTVKGPDAIIDPEEIQHSMGSLYNDCQGENPGGACFAQYNEKGGMAEYPVMCATGIFVCRQIRSQGCTDRIAAAATEAELSHRRLYSGNSEVEVSINGKMKDES